VAMLKKLLLLLLKIGAFWFPIWFPGGYWIFKKCGFTRTGQTIRSFTVTKSQYFLQTRVRWLKFGTISDMVISLPSCMAASSLDQHRHLYW